MLGSIKSSLKDVGKMISKPMVAVKDGASKVLGSIKDKLKSLAKGVTVAVSVAGVSVDTTQSNGFASKDNPDPDTRVWKQSQITYTDGLKAGDMVLVQKLNDNNKYVIIARVVEA